MFSKAQGSANVMPHLQAVVRPLAGKNRQTLLLHDFSHTKADNTTQIAAVARLQTHTTACKLGITDNAGCIVQFILGTTP